MLAAGKASCYDGGKLYPEGKFMIEVDDAGGGCFAGPEVLVIQRPGKRPGPFRYIDPGVTERVPEATRLLKQVFRDLRVSKETQYGSAGRDLRPLSKIS